VHAAGTRARQCNAKPLGLVLACICMLQWPTASDSQGASSVARRVAAEGSSLKLPCRLQHGAEGEAPPILTVKLPGRPECAVPFHLC